MTRSRRRPAAVLTAAVLAALCAPVAPGSYAAEAAPPWFVSRVSDGQDEAAGSTLWRAANATVTVQGSLADGLWVHVTPAGASEPIIFGFAAPTGQSLAPGTYEADGRELWSRGAHPAAYVSTRYTCPGSGADRFVVHEAAEDLSRLRLSYELRCWGLRGTFGEISYGLPPADGLMVAPGSVSWPSYHLGYARREVPVTLVNTSAAPIAVTSAAVSGDPDFTRVSSTCTTVAPGGTCAVRLGFTPKAAGARAGTLTLQTGAVMRTVPLAGTGIAAASSWTTARRELEDVPLTRRSFDPSNATVRAHGDETHVTASVQDWASTYQDMVDFYAPAGRLLVPGLHVVVKEQGDTNVDGGLQVQSGFVGSCATREGSYTIHEAAYDGTALTKFSATYELRCTSDATSVYGSVRWMADQAARPLPTIDGKAPPPVTGFVAYPMVTSVFLAWDDPAGPDWARTIVRGAPGTTPPASATAGFDAYSGTDGGRLLTELAPSTPFAFSAFTRDLEGKTGPRKTIVLRGTSVSLSPSTSRLKAGSAATLRGRLVDAASGAAVAGVRVGVDARRAGTRTWTRVGNVTTSATGAWSKAHKPTATTEYRVTFYGVERRLGATSRIVTVRVV